MPAWRPRVVQYRTKAGIQILRQRSSRAFQDPSQSVEDTQSKRRFKGPAVETSEVDGSDLNDGRIADQAIEVMCQIRNEPFFLAVGFVKPHVPYVAPKKYSDLYSADVFSTPVVDELPSGAPPQAHNGDSRELRGYVGIDSKGPIPANQARWVTHGYNAGVSYVDAQIERLMSTFRIGECGRSRCCLSTTVVDLDYERCAFTERPPPPRILILSTQRRVVNFDKTCRSETR